jgi:hypothetical protein
MTGVNTLPGEPFQPLVPRLKPGTSSPRRALSSFQKRAFLLILERSPPVLNPEKPRQSSDSVYGDRLKQSSLNPLKNEEKFNYSHPPSRSRPRPTHGV